ncbi:MAG: hypothetical protein AMXMBFR33_57900 [Candidatus Xenobia bacterium]
MFGKRSKKTDVSAVVARVNEVLAEIEAARAQGSQAEEQFEAAALKEAELQRELEEARNAAILEMMDERRAEHDAARADRDVALRQLDAHLLAIEPLFKRLQALEGRLLNARAAYGSLARQYGVDPTRPIEAGGRRLEPLRAEAPYGFQPLSQHQDGPVIFCGGLLGAISERMQWLKFGQDLAAKFSEDV